MSNHRWLSDRTDGACYLTVPGVAIRQWEPCLSFLDQKRFQEHKESQFKSVTWFVLWKTEAEGSRPSEALFWTEVDTARAPT